ncbi:hypothetical protein Taro_041232 [Colocasia esculenta]|uniref:Uncharacterized protein n=1 Tax=Colocasia esculenta TaxID=4460 RepID=A0A843WKY6_COLES|nr:hypothetical protein [Colocasia esculenta]
MWDPRRTTQYTRPGLEQLRFPGVHVPPSFHGKTNKKQILLLLLSPPDRTYVLIAEFGGELRRFATVIPEWRPRKSPSISEAGGFFNPSSPSWLMSRDQRCRCLIMPNLNLTMHRRKLQSTVNRSKLLKKVRLYYERA